MFCVYMYMYIRMPTINIYLECKSFLNVILHQFWVKKNFPWKFNLEYDGTFTKFFMHVSSRNMLPTTRYLQFRVNVYRHRHCCGDELVWHSVRQFRKKCLTERKFVWPNKNLKCHYIFRISIKNSFICLTCLLQENFVR